MKITKIRVITARRPLTIIVVTRANTMTFILRKYATSGSEIYPFLRELK